MNYKFLVQFFFQVFLLFCFFCGSLKSVESSSTPADQFLLAYQAFQQAEKLERTKNYKEASAKYHFAESILIDLSANNPNWQKPVVDYRLSKIQERLQRIDSSNAFAPPPSDTIEGETSSTVVSRAQETTPSRAVEQLVDTPSISVTPPVPTRKVESSVSSQLSDQETVQLYRQLKKMEGELEKTRGELVEKATELDHSKVTIVDMKSQLEKAERQVNDLRSDLAKNRSGSSQREALLQQSIHELQGKVDNLSADQEVITEENSQLQKQLKGASDSLVAGLVSKQRLEQLQLEVNKEKNAGALLREKLLTAEKERTTASELSVKLQKQLKEANTSLAFSQKKTEEVEVLRAQLAKLQIASDEKNKMLLETREKAEKLASSENNLNNELQEKLMALGASQEALQKEKSALEANLKEANSSLAAAEQRSADTALLREQMAKLQTDSEEKNKQLLEAKEKADKLASSESNLNNDLQKKLKTAEENQSIIQKEKIALEDKLKKMGEEMGALQQTENNDTALREQITSMKSELQSASQQLSEAVAAKAELESSNKTAILQVENKLKVAEDDQKMLEAKKQELEKQLTETNNKMVALMKNAPNETAIKEELSHYKSELAQTTLRLNDSEKKIILLEKAAPEKDQLLVEKEKELSLARQESEKLQKDLLAANQQLSTLQEEVHQKDTRYNELKLQFDQKSEEIALLKKNHSQTEAKAIAENELLKGIVLRELKEEAKRQQIKKLITEDLQKMKVNSSNLSLELQKLAKPVKLTDEERALFKDVPLAILSTPDIEEAQETKLTVSVAASKKDETPLTKETENASGAAPVLNEGTPASKGTAAADAKNISDNGGKKEDKKEPSPQDKEKYREILAKTKEQFEHQNYSEAEKGFQDALLIVPDDYMSLSNLGVVEFQLGKMSEAEKALKKAASLDHQKSFALTTLGIVYYREEHLDEAEKVLRQAIAVNEQDFTAHNYLGIVLAASGKGKAGESEIMKALEINPKYADAHFNLAVIYATSKPPAKQMAKTHYNKAIALGAPPDTSLEKMME